MALGDIKLYRKLASFKMYLQKGFNKNAKLHWYKSANFGDALNPILFKFITGKEVSWIASEFYNQPNFSMIGSILQVVNQETIVWGSGFLNADSKFHYGKPKKVHAVRGPKTREKLLAMGVDCPEVYGDPALLLPNYYKPTINKKYKLGIIPHYVNKNDDVLLKLKDNPDIIIIDVMNPDTLSVVNDIISCEKILSSSLHGIIISDAYKIPSQWIKFKKNISSDDFKFYDYTEAVDKKISPVYIENFNNLLDIKIQEDSFEINFDDKKLLDSCPFT